jgi:glycine cleavage system H protein
MMADSLYRYTRDHAWVLVEGQRALVGLSAFAQEELGEIAYVELPPVGKGVSRGEAVCTVDSLKSSSEIYAPLSGTVVEVNPALASEEGSALVNMDPLGAGWIFCLEMSNPAELDGLLSETEYRSYVDGE